MSNMLWWFDTKSAGPSRLQPARALHGEARPAQAQAGHERLLQPVDHDLVRPAARGPRRALEEIEDEKDQAEGGQERDGEDPVAEAADEERGFTLIPATCRSTSWRVTIPTKRAVLAHERGRRLPREERGQRGRAARRVSMTGKGGCMTSDTGRSRTLASASARAMSGPSLSEPTHSLPSTTGICETSYVPMRFRAWRTLAAGRDGDEGRHVAAPARQQGGRGDALRSPAAGSRASSCRRTASRGSARRCRRGW